MHKDEYSDDDDFEQNVVDGKDSKQVDQDYPHIVKVDDIVVQPLEDPLEEKPQVLTSPKSLNQSQALLIKPDSDNDEVPGDSEELDKS